MAETRSKTTSRVTVNREEGSEESRIEQVLSRTEALEKLVEDQNKKIEDNMKDIFEAIRLISTNKEASSDEANQQNHGVLNHEVIGENLDQNRNNRNQERNERNNQHQNYSGLTRLGKVDFPRFNGDGIKEWLFKVEEFFAIDGTPADYKVKMAAIHFDSHAFTWHHSMVQSANGGGILFDWTYYKGLLKERFEDECDDPVAELKRLQKTDGIVDYHEKFEVIKTRLNLSEDYLVSNYLAGLRNDTQMHIRMFRPQTVRHCLVLGRLYEKAHPRRNGSNTWVNNKTIPQMNQNKGILQYKKEAELKPIYPTTYNNKNPGTQPRKFLSNEEMSERRAKGLCYFCDEKYTPGHYVKHKKTQLFSMEVDEEQDEFEDCMESEEELEEEIRPRISVNAVQGISTYRTMRVKGLCGKKVIFILIDSGSTHNFIDADIADKIGCVSKKSKIEVEVADGRKLGVSGKVDQFKWQIHTTTFTGEFLLIPLGGCDMVLGCQWLETLGPITWDFKKLYMKFTYEKQKVLLHGLEQGSVREVKASKISKKQTDQVQLSMICVRDQTEESHVKLCAIEAEEDSEKNSPELEQMMVRYEDIFAEPTSLPPFRNGHNHKIPLKEGSDPINQRPYRYAVYQKNEIDKMVEEMLKSGTIQNSSSPYASPVVLVKKKDGTWRLCVDYRGLNGLTVKERFPIPLIEDLMDELGGSKIYSKIDLRAGYHQIRMEPQDIHKTAFKTHSGHFEYLVMPFGLTNAPATFQGLMNAVFKKFLRKFVLIFFDDILIYSATLAEHVEHVQMVFEVMRQNKLFAKRSKCAFATKKVEYLGHYIEEKGISTDPNKIKAVEEWNKPENLKQLRGFLGLAGYYRRFVKNFGTIARPLTALTKRNAFEWSDEAQEAFQTLKKGLCEAPVLALPRFDQPFVVETDACTHGIGAVLMQNGHPLAYISRHLKGKQLHLSIYEKELLAVIFAVQKWRHYLLPNHFFIKTDQRSLKYLLEQRLNTPIQQQWLPKLMEFSYEIQYRQGKDNVAADALSRVEGAEILHMAMSVLECDLMMEIQRNYDGDTALKEIIEELKKKPNSKKHYSWIQNVLRRKSKIVVPMKPELKDKILQWLHCSGSGGHSGRDVTHQRVKGLFYWKGMIKDIQSYIRSCNVCQQCKYETLASPGLLQPLSIPETIWSNISMDFIDGLPYSFGKTVIFVVVDRLSKAAHFMPLSHPYNAVSVAQVFLDNVYKLHGCPQTIVSDRDTVFLSEFWRELFTLQGVSLNFSSAYHPQSDGQTVVVNRGLETYLRCMCSDRPHLWSKWIPLAEWWYNTNFHTAIQMTPYEAVYGQPPPVHLPYLPGESKVAVVSQSLQDRENMLLILKFHLLRAQHRMKQLADQHRTERSFDIGDYVFVKLQPYRQQSVVMRSNQKLSPKYFGPYKIIDKCGEVAYKLELPSGSAIHPVFHVSQLKVLVGDVHTTTQLPSVLLDVLQKEPERVIQRKMVQRQGHAATMVLIKWTNEPVEEATWEYLFQIKKNYPLFEP
ncbi:putative mitochondrial protein [Cardamine amara subsp. amara]|uniref:Mitochondrial protein n=1 Tax=Cardamine amara subsp. amara TaxID=228776 RepID=A0ABD1C5A3_CARAN